MFRQGTRTDANLGEYLSRRLGQAPRGLVQRIYPRLVSTWESVVRARTELGSESIGRLRLLVREWALVADLGFSDLVLFVRTWDGAGWIAIAHVRPSTASTVFKDDPVGVFVPRSRAVAMERAMQSGRTVRLDGREGQPDQVTHQLSEPREVVPVTHERTAIAVLARYSEIDEHRIGDMEHNYLAACNSLLAMIAVGAFPEEMAQSVGAAAPRVGDGIVRLDADGLITYASPNARTCLRRLGVSQSLVGNPLADLLARVVRQWGPVDRAVRQISAGLEVGSVEFGTGAVVASMRAVPLRGANRPGGAVVLLRDITELRSQEKALLSKDATIREIHHRVKNNLQTVGALLRLQARRQPVGMPRAALLDAVSRVNTIALVHESLAHSPGERVDFDEIGPRIVAMAKDTAAAQDHPIPQVKISGSSGVLPSEVATPLAMVLSELLLNAMEHSGAQRVWIEYERDDSQIKLRVIDDGAGFDPWRIEGLGLDIVQTLVSDQLHGHLAIWSSNRPVWPRELPNDVNNETERRGTTTAGVVCPLD